MRKSSTRWSSRRTAGAALTLSEEGLTIRDAATGKAERTLPRKDIGSLYTLQAPGKPMRVLTPTSERHFVLRADGAQFAWLHSMDGSESLTLYETATGKKLRGWIKGGVPWSGAAAVSPDGRLVAADNSTTVQLFDAATGKILAEWGTEQGPLNALAFSPDGGALATGDGNGELKVWNLVWIRKELAALGLDW